uniref:FAD/NAD(P)-binding domain-containing protein n=1 Tax=Octactis speculum TaxID=3111310 RepID=A0A7S2CPJ1_9STRA|mmetsp:Transcript_38353/g.51967  ORF Transcript_38353/g.51967 Transcript_38353/m.51967 type:complete len:501 (+) Transcript_38353:88-1590(+)
MFRQAANVGKATAAVAFGALNECALSSGEEDKNSRASLARRNTARPQKNFHEFVIVGGGSTAHAAIEGIMMTNPKADILMLSEDSKVHHIDAELEANLSSDFLDAYNEWRRHLNPSLDTEPDAVGSVPLTLLLQRTQDKLHLDVEGKSLLLDDGTSVSYNKCLIASCGTPKEFYVLDETSFEAAGSVLTMNTLKDFARLDELCSSVQNVTVVGGGFLGTELAVALARRGARSGLKVAHMYVEDGPLARHLPRYLSKHVQKLITAIGVETVAQQLCTDIKKQADGERLRMTLADDWEWMTDTAVLASTHVDPKNGIAEDSPGLELDPSSGGIVVNSQLEALNGVYAAGATASYPDMALGRRRGCSYDHAVMSGLHAGKNMASDTPVLYRHLPMFHSHLRGIKVVCDGIGRVDASLRTVGFWAKKPDSPQSIERGVIFYKNTQNKIVGALCWNASDTLERVRDIMQHKHTADQDALQEYLSLAPESWVTVVETKRAGNNPQD